MSKRVRLSFSLLFAIANFSLAEAETWLLQVQSDESAEELIQRHGLINHGALDGVPGYYRVSLPVSLSPQASDSVTKAETIRSDAAVLELKPAVKRMRYPRQFVPADPLFGRQWHLDNDGQTDGKIWSDARVQGAWDRGYSGEGVVVAIVDEGTEYQHPDLIDNWVVGYRVDYNDDDGDPSPSSFEDRHGTAVAGIAVARSNQIGGLGAAHKAGLVPIRLIAGPIDDGEEAEALRYGSEIVDIYNNSWGPSDQLGVRFSGAGNAAKTAIRTGALQGRDGKGAIYVWAAGNGGLNGDNSNYDGYNSSPYTISVGAIGHDDVRATYSEGGSNLLVVAPSRGKGPGITTTDNSGSSGYSSSDFTNDFSGTSAAAPLVSGVVALMLEARPDLYWWEVQQILALTAVPVDLQEGQWRQNSAGLWFSENYGFGRIDATAAVRLAEEWPAGGNYSVITRRSGFSIGSIPFGQTLESTLEVNEGRIVHSVEVRFESNHTDWGDLDLRLRSPQGTECRLIIPHTNSNSPGLPDEWTFLIAHLLGEPTDGVWTLLVEDRGTGGSGSLLEWDLIIHSTEPGLNNAPPSGPDAFVDRIEWPVELDPLEGLSDPDGDPLQVLAISYPSDGFLTTLENGKIRYNMSDPEDGVDEFSILVSDQRGGVLRRTFSLRDPRPVANRDIFAVRPGAQAVLPVLANDRDADGDSLRILSTSPVQFGSASTTTNSIRYTANPSSVGIERIQYSITDDSDGSSSGWATVVVDESPEVRLSFDGIDDVLEFAGGPSGFELEDEFTVAAWIYPENYGEYVTGFGRILDKVNFIVFLNGYDHGFYNDESLVVFIDQGSGRTTAVNTRPGTLQLNRWQHVCVTYNLADPSQTVRIYLNGQLVPQSYPIEESSPPDRSIAPNSIFPLTIGESSNGARAFAGLIQQPVIWSEPLTDGEVADLYQVGDVSKVLATRLFDLDLVSGYTANVPNLGVLGGEGILRNGAFRSIQTEAWTQLESAFNLEDDRGNGWWREQTIGWIFGDVFPWIYYPPLGWVYRPFGDFIDPDQIQLFALSGDADWWLTSPAAYPNFYVYPQQGWRMYLEGSFNPAWYYDYDSSGWISVSTP